MLEKLEPLAAELYATPLADGSICCGVHNQRAAEDKILESIKSQAYAANSIPYLMCGLFIFSNLARSERDLIPMVACLKIKSDFESRFGICVSLQNQYLTFKKYALFASKTFIFASWPMSS